MTKARIFGLLCLWALLGLSPLNQSSAQNAPAEPESNGFSFDQSFALNLPRGWNFGEVASVALTAEGHFIVFHRGGHPLLEFDSDGTFIQELGQGLFEKPHGLAVDADGNIWTTDVATHAVLKLDPDGRILMVLGKKGGPGPERIDPLFKGPTNLAFDGAGNIYVADGDNNRIVKFSATGQLITTWGSTGSGPGQFDLPHSIAIDENNQVYVADRENQRIQIFDPEGNFLRAWTEIGFPYNLVLDDDQTIWFTDGQNERVVHLDKAGTIIEAFGVHGRGPGAFSSVHGIALTPEGTIITTEIYNWRVQRFKPLR